MQQVCEGLGYDPGEVESCRSKSGRGINRFCQGDICAEPGELAVLGEVSREGNESITRHGDSRTEKSVGCSPPLQASLHLNDEPLIAVGSPPRPGLPPEGRGPSNISHEIRTPGQPSPQPMAPNADSRNFLDWERDLLLLDWEHDIDYTLFELRDQDFPVFT